MSNILENKQYHESLPSKMNKVMLDYHPVQDDVTSTNSKTIPTLKLMPNVVGDTFVTTDFEKKYNNFMKKDGNNTLGVSKDGCPDNKIIFSIGFARFILILNIFFPGIGTIAAGCYDKSNRGEYIKYGIMQLLTACIIVGWVWAIIFSIKLLDNVKNNY